MRDGLFVGGLGAGAMARFGELVNHATKLERKIEKADGLVSRARLKVR
jgi:hypothetical protein